MQIVLLSGGSGKRLWPLSNNTRSKQFLKLLKAPDGSYESMVQRVYRQLTEAGFRAPITIATSISQADSIHSQLGNAVDMVLEPERRNTYPAIALSCAYLASEKHVPREETVIVLPVDPYAEQAYFDTLRRMDDAVQSGTAQLVLMGIQPTYPSEKYGYIVPVSNHRDEPVPVARFTEKPSAADAETLIANGAVWNGGVFAFRLGWLLDTVQAQTPFAGYPDLYQRYTELKKNSFDYEVVEKANSIAMVSYQGIWKDLGTWNTLTEQMENERIGNCVSGEDTVSTHIINELEIPIVALGTSNLIIAASPDGILVSDKAKSSYLKPYVDQMDCRPMYEERRWGEYKVLEYNTFGENQRSMTKRLRINAAQNISYQSHRQRDEIWTFIEGTGELLLDGHIRNVRRGDVAYITKGMKHAIRAISDLYIIEVQIGEELTEEDIERFDWNWR
jgi:mannose-1-phosphate guanylyltransferase